MTNDLITKSDRLLRLPEVCHRVGLGKTSIYGLINKGTFPKPLKITAFAARWREQDVVTWMHSLNGRV